jgi:hypothetical protein
MLHHNLCKRALIGYPHRHRCLLVLIVQVMAAVLLDLFQK